MTDDLIAAAGAKANTVSSVTPVIHPSNLKHRRTGHSGCFGSFRGRIDRGLEVRDPFVCLLHWKCMFRKCEKTKAAFNQ